MKKLIMLLVLVFYSCNIPPEYEGPIDNTNPIITLPPPGNGGTITGQSLAGQTWRIWGYRVGPMGDLITISDTLKFIDNSKYTYNDYPTTYYLTSTGSGYNLSLYETPWGNLSGSVLTNNIVMGKILGIKFVDISVGSSNTTQYYLWMNKI